MMSSTNILGHIQSKYIIGQTIGSGGQAEVKIGRCKPNVKPGGNVAIKVAKITPNNPRSLMDKEIDLLRHIDTNDPKNEVNVVRFFESVADHHHVIMVLELCSGGELFDDIIDNGKYNEYQAAASVMCMARILSHLQHLGIVHRDIKPENFVYDCKDKQTRKLKLIDFGMACRDTDHESVRRSGLGTPAYQAPEIYMREAATTASDVWAFGVVLFIMLSGTFPFNPNNGDAALKKQIISGAYTFAPREWEHISVEAKDLISRMLTVDVKKRITVAEVMTHPWLHQQNVDRVTFTSNYFERMRATKAQKELRGAVLAMVTAKKWMKRSLKHAAADADVNVFKPKPAVTGSSSADSGAGSEKMALEEVAAPEEEPTTFIEISVADLKSLLVKFRVRCERAAAATGAPAGADVALTAGLPPSRWEVDFPTFATVVSSVYSCRVFCSLVFYNMFDAQQTDRLDYRKFVLAIASLRQTIDDEWVAFTFSLFDEDGSRAINRSEFTAFAPCFCGTAGGGGRKGRSGSLTQKRSSLANDIATVALGSMPAKPGSPRAGAMPPAPPSTSSSSTKGSPSGASEPMTTEDEPEDEAASLMAAFAEVDRDGSGQIDFGEFKEWVISLYGQGKCTRD